MKKIIFAIIVGIGAIIWLSYWLVDNGFKHDMRAAEQDCSQYGAVPEYTYQTRYICVTPDGRVVRR
jgi:hypothetical protein